MLKIVTSVSTNLFTVCIIRRFMTAFFSSGAGDRKKEWIANGLFLLLTESAFLFLQYPPVTTLLNIILLYVISCQYEGSRKKKILVTLFVYSVCMVSEILAVYTCGGHAYGREFRFVPIVPCITVLLVCICELITERFLFRHREFYYIPHCNALILVPVISIALLLYLIMSNMEQRSAFIAISLCMLFINLLLFYLSDVLMGAFAELEDRLMFERLAAGYENQRRVMIQSDEKIQSLRHDMKHHLNELLLLAEKGEKEETTAYIDKMRASLDNPNEYISSGNKGVDSLLNYMLQEAKEKLEQVDYKISVPREMGIHSFDLNVVVGNLLENAIFAAAASRKKWLSVSMNYEKGMLFIRVRNSYDNEIKKKGELYLSTRQEGHGIGLQNVKKAVENYCGSMEITDEDHIFDVKIMLYTLQNRRAASL